ncbi:MAG: formate dehydrogenase accessory protein FdhE [Hyphomicrobiales bacterium]
MSKAGLPRYDPVPIGEVAEPPFVRLPDPRSIFRVRAERFMALASRHKLGPYLRLLGGLASLQHDIQDGLPEPDLPGANARERAREFGMPPLDRQRFCAEDAFEATFERLISRAAAIEMPAAARAAVARARDADLLARDAMARAVLDDSIPVGALAEHIFTAAALQVHFARLAARLVAERLVPVGDGACPSCGGPPATSLIVGWQGAHGTRFCACGLCATLWNYVRIKCVLCGSTSGISYQEIENTTDTIKAETCDRCRGYVKILHQHRDASLDPIADDVASLGLDLLMREADYRRGGVNCFIYGH